MACKVERVERTWSGLPQSVNEVCGPKAEVDNAIKPSASSGSSAFWVELFGSEETVQLSRLPILPV